MVSFLQLGFKETISTKQQDAAGTKANNLIRNAPDEEMKDVDDDIKIGLQFRLKKSSSYTVRRHIWPGGAWYEDAPVETSCRDARCVGRSLGSGLQEGAYSPMKLAKLCFALATLGLAVAMAASSYKVTLPSDVSAGSVTLKAGDYKVEVEGNQATFRQGKEEIKVPATVETSTIKFADTNVETSGTNLQAIDIGGTTTKIVFKSAN